VAEWLWLLTSNHLQKTILWVRIPTGILDYFIPESSQPSLQNVCGSTRVPEIMHRRPSSKAEKSPCDVHPTPSQKEKNNKQKHFTKNKEDHQMYLHNKVSKYY
jgi:hypothetical protein